MVEGYDGRVAFDVDLLEAEAKRWGFNPRDTEGGAYLYRYANIGHVADRWALDYWWACPASYARKNPTPAVSVARAAIEAAQWIREGVPQWALDGQPPTPRMATLIQMCLSFWRIEEAEAKAKAYEDARNNKGK